MARVHAQLQQVQDTLRTLQDQNADLVALNTRLQLGMGKPRHEAPVYVEDLPQEREADPEPMSPGEEPRADLWPG